MNDLPDGHERLSPNIFLPVLVLVLPLLVLSPVVPGLGFQAAPSGCADPSESSALKHF